MNNKNKKQCGAFAIRTNNRCQKKAFRGTNYCWLHYPKKAPLNFLFIGAVFSLFLTVLFFEDLNNLRRRFLVKEQEDLEISVSYETFNESQDKKEFLEFVGERKKLLSNSELFIYNINFRNKADKLLLRSMHITVDLSNIVYDWQEIGSFKVKNAIDYHLIDSANKGISKKRAFVSQRFLRIDEIAPGGFIAFRVLAGSAKRRSKPSTMNVGIFGNYISEGYGNTEIKEIKCWMPAKRGN